MKQLIFFLFTLFVVNNGSAQYFADVFNVSSGAPEKGCGYLGGYGKLGINSLLLRHKHWEYCSGIKRGSSIYAYDSTGEDYGGLKPYVFILSNVDSSIKSSLFRVVPTHYFNQGSFLYPLQFVHMIRKDCDRCTWSLGFFSHIWEMLERRNELTSDSAWTLFPTAASVYPNQVSYNIPLVDTQTNSLTIFHGHIDIFLDSLYSQELHNVPAWGGVQVYGTPNELYRWGRSWTIPFSRLYRYQAYTDIRSPELRNKQVIAAIKGVEMNWNLGFSDTGRGQWDSIRVITEPLRIRKGPWHPLVSAANFTGQPGQVAQIKQWLRDSTQWVSYYNGYSHTQPFGGGPASGNSGYFNLNASTGQASFLATDTGAYLLSFRIQEYRDGQLLGDIPYYRVAYVTDSAAVVQPYLNMPLGIVTNGSYNAAEPSFTLCPGQSLSFSMQAGSTLSNSGINMSTSLPILSTPGATITYSGQGTNSVTATFNWTPTLADTGHHYFFADIVDTTCQPGHLPNHLSKGLRIKVRAPVLAAAASALLCPGQSTQLLADARPPLLWAVLPGGSTAPLSCTSCASPTVSPTVSTRYLLTSSAGICPGTDTVDVAVMQDFTLKALGDTFFCAPPPFQYGISAAPVYTVPVGAFAQPPLQYQWQALPGYLSSLSAQYTTVLNPALPATYIVTATDAKGCFTHKDTVSIWLCNGIGNVPGLPGGLELYPNPVAAGGLLQVVLPGLGLSTATMLRLYTLDGRLVTSDVASTGLSHQGPMLASTGLASTGFSHRCQLQVPLGTAAGLYLLRISQEGRGDGYVKVEVR